MAGRMSVCLEGKDPKGKERRTVVSRYGNLFEDSLYAFHVNLYLFNSIQADNFHTVSPL
jgi:hypothetical protein